MQGLVQSRERAQKEHRAGRKVDIGAVIENLCCKAVVRLANPAEVQHLVRFIRESQARGMGINR